MARNRKRNRNRGRQPPRDKAAGIAMAEPAAERPGDDELLPGQVPASPEEQAVFEKFRKNYLRVVYGTGSKPGPKGEPPLIQEILAMLKDVPDPVFALGSAAETVVSQLSEGAEAAGEPIPGDVLMHSGVAVVEDLAELAERAGIHEYTEEEMGEALKVGMSMYIQEHPNIDKAAFEADIAAMKQAEASGTLDDMFPGISEYAARAEQEMGGQPTQTGMPPRGLRRA